MKPFEGLKKEDEKLAGIFESSGLGHNQAHVLVYVKSRGETTSKDIQRATRLRQPEVSIAMKDLRTMKWIDKKDQKREKGKGRPTHIYYVQASFSEMLDHFIDEDKRQIAKIQKDIGELEALKKTL
jgi:predicted transcriptional regulator